MSTFLFYSISSSCFILSFFCLIVLCCSASQVVGNSGNSGQHLINLNATNTTANSSAAANAAIAANTRTLADTPELADRFISIDEDPSAEHLRSIVYAQRNHSLKHTGEPTLCPPGATVDGTWGISDPKYNTLEFYNEATKFSPQSVFGKWFSGPRSEVLPMICDSGNAADCEWDKPDRWSPFKGSDAYDSRKVAAVYYPLSNKNQQQQQPTPADFKSTRAKSAPKLESELNFCYSFQDPLGCLRNRVVLFLGDSHMLNLAQTLCRMLLKKLPQPQDREQYKSVCGPLDIRPLWPISIAYINTTNTTIALLRVRYQLEKQMRNRFDATPSGWPQFLEKHTSFVVYNRGMWDLVHNDTNRKLVAVQLTDSLTYLARRFKKARIIFKAPQHDHKHSGWCVTPERLREMRDANICGVYLAMQETAQLNRLRLWRARKAFTESHRGGGESAVETETLAGALDPFWKFSFFDVFGMTREVEYDNATDKAGHHYEGSVVESMVQMLLATMCPAQPQNYTLLFERFERSAQMSCRRLIENSSDLRLPVCACNDPVAREANLLGRGICARAFSVGHWVAFRDDI